MNFEVTHKCSACLRSAAVCADDRCAQRLAAAPTDPDDAVAFEVSVYMLELEYELRKSANA